MQILLIILQLIRFFTQLLMYMRALKQNPTDGHCPARNIQVGIPIELTTDARPDFVSGLVVPEADREVSPGPIYKRKMNAENVEP